MSLTGDHVFNGLQTDPNYAKVYELNKDVIHKYFTSDLSIPAEHLLAYVLALNVFSKAHISEILLTYPTKGPKQWLEHSFQEIFSDGQVTNRKIVEILEVLTALIGKDLKLMQLTKYLSYYFSTAFLNDHRETVNSRIEKTGGWAAILDVGAAISSFDDEPDENIAKQTFKPIPQNNCSCGTKKPESKTQHACCVGCNRFICMLTGCTKVFENKKAVTYHQHREHSREERENYQKKMRSFCTCGAPRSVKGCHRFGKCGRCFRYWCLIDNCHADYLTLSNVKKHASMKHKDVEGDYDDCSACQQPKLRDGQQLVECSCRMNWCMIGGCKYEDKQKQRVINHQKTEHIKDLMSTPDYKQIQSQRYPAMAVPSHEILMPQTLPTTEYSAMGAGPVAFCHCGRSKPPPQSALSKCSKCSIHMCLMPGCFSLFPMLTKAIDHVLKSHTIEDYNIFQKHRAARCTCGVIKVRQPAEPFAHCSICQRHWCTLGYCSADFLCAKSHRQHLTSCSFRPTPAINECSQCQVPKVRDGIKKIGQCMLCERYWCCVDGCLYENVSFTDVRRHQAIVHLNIKLHEAFFSTKTDRCFCGWPKPKASSRSVKCYSCSMYVCIKRGCPQACTTKHDMFVHQHTIHKSTFFIEYCSCGAIKTRTIGGRFSQCGTCHRYWCLLGGCNYEKTTKNEMMAHLIHCTDRDLCSRCFHVKDRSYVNIRKCPYCDLYWCNITGCTYEHPERSMILSHQAQTCHSLPKPQTIHDRFGREVVFSVLKSSQAK